MRQPYLFAFKISPIASYGQFHFFQRFSESFSSHKVRFILSWCIKFGVFARCGAWEEWEWEIVWGRIDGSFKFSLKTSEGAASYVEKKKKQNLPGKDSV